MDTVHTIRTRELDKFIIIKQVISKHITQQEAAAQLKMSDRHIRRLVCKVNQDGIHGLKSKHKGGNRLISHDLKAQIMSRVCEIYSDFGPTFAQEKLTEEGYKISKETLRKWMIEASLWKSKKPRHIRLHQSRERRPRFGELIQIDGSHHDWFEGRRSKCCLLVFIDDATSRIVGLRFEESETTLGYMRLVKEQVQNFGRPLAYYSDKHSIFKTTREGAMNGHYPDTQLVRAMRDLNIESICAHSPQAKGRVERANQTLQDRLIKEMRLLGISSIEAANAYLPAFIKKYNERFSVQSLDTENAHRPNLHTEEQLNQILSIQTRRVLSKNLEFSFEAQIYQVMTPNVSNRLKYKAVTVCQMMDGTINVTKDQMNLMVKILPMHKKNYEADTKEINDVVDTIIFQDALKQNLKIANL